MLRVTKAKRHPDTEGERHPRKASMPQGENALRREMQDSLLSYIRADSMMRSIYAAVVLAQIWLSRLARREASMLRPCLHGHNRAKELRLCPIQ